jgi:hypothetical protein
LFPLSRTLGIARSAPVAEDRIETLGGIFV